MDTEGGQGHGPCRFEEELADRLKRHSEWRNLGSERRVRTRGIGPLKNLRETKRITHKLCMTS